MNYLIQNLHPFFTFKGVGKSRNKLTGCKNDNRLHMKAGKYKIAHEGWKIYCTFKNNDEDCPHDDKGIFLH